VTQPFTALSIPAVCEATPAATIIGFREGGLYPLLARFEFPYEVPNYELHWLTKEGRYSPHGQSVYDLQIVSVGRDE
jgi:hypothetical protein